jgi:hypothetical protein
VDFTDEQPLYNFEKIEEIVGGGRCFALDKVLKFNILQYRPNLVNNNATLYTTSGPNANGSINHQETRPKIMIRYTRKSALKDTALLEAGFTASHEEQIVPPGPSRRADPGVGGMP